MADIKSVRRHYLHKRIYARLYEDSDSAAVWQAKQEAQPGTPLPSTFAHKADLSTIGYTTKEDLDGADATELERAGLTGGQAKTVIAAFAAL